MGAKKAKSLRYYCKQHKLFEELSHLTSMANNYWRRGPWFKHQAFPFVGECVIVQQNLRLVPFIPQSLSRLKTSIFTNANLNSMHGRWHRGAGTNIVDRGLKVLFFGLFCYFSVFFPLVSLENFLPTPLILCL